MQSNQSSKARNRESAEHLAEDNQWASSGGMQKTTQNANGPNPQDQAQLMLSPDAACLQQFNNDDLDAEGDSIMQWSELYYNTNEYDTKIKRIRL